MEDFFDSFEEGYIKSKPISNTKAALILLAVSATLLLLGAVVSLCVLIGVVAAPFIIAVGLLIVAVRRIWG